MGNPQGEMQKLYKKAYNKGILKENVDWLMDNSIINNEIEIINNSVVEFVKICVLMAYRIKEENTERIDYFKDFIYPHISKIFNKSDLYGYTQLG